MEEQALSKLTSTQKLALEQLFDMEGGYVLNFSNRTFSGFIQDTIQIDIYTRYHEMSKARMLRSLISECEDYVVGKLILELLNYMKLMKLITEEKRELFHVVDKVGNDLINSMENITKENLEKESDKAIFVTYSWDSEEHRTKVASFVAFLRNNGFNATFDEELIQNQTAINFGTMMVSRFHKSDKILVVLSRGYAEKANTDSGGVGVEYQYIINDIKNSPTKYILVSFEELIENIIDEITPFGLKGREIVDLNSDVRDGYQKLFSKLRDQKIINLPPVAKVKAEIKEKVIPEFKPNGHKQKGKISYYNECLYKHPNEFFEDRLSQSFPGIRGIKWFTKSNEIINRLKVLLKEPLCINGANNPIWWFRGSLSMQIEKCHFINEKKFLMNHQECKVDKICVYRSQRCDRSFLYVELEAEEPTGVYDYSVEDTLREMQTIGYAREEYGIFETCLLTREEYDDGAKFIDGEIINFATKDVKLRCRFLSKYNFIICALFNPINSVRNDSDFENFLNGMLDGSVNMEEIIEHIEKLPRLEGHG